MQQRWSTAGRVSCLKEEKLRERERERENELSGTQRN